MQCKNNLKQLSLGMITHHEHKNYFPTGGWGYTWTGEPERGTDCHQPGGWGFNILNYIEQENLRELGTDLTGAARYSVMEQRNATPLAAFICPTRRKPTAFPDNVNTDAYRTRGGTFGQEVSGRTDYAANVGNPDVYLTNQGPISLNKENSYNWPDLSEFSGICFVRSEIAIKDITDGTSCTYLLGEKYINPYSYETGDDSGDNQPLYAGYCADNYRGTSIWHGGPHQDQPGWSDVRSFGSAHASGCHMSFCDGSVRMIDYNIDPIIHKYLGNRHDGIVLDGKKF